MVFFTGIGITFILVGLVPLLAFAQEESPTIDPEMPVVEEVSPTAQATQDAMPTTAATTQVAEATRQVTQAAEATAQQAEASPQPEATAEVREIYDVNAYKITPTGNNSYCAVCHNQAWRAVTLKDGYVLNLFVSPETITNSVHGASNPKGALGCVDCHGQDSFPHTGVTPTDVRSYTLKSVNICVGCHAEEATHLKQGLHERAILLGNKAAAVCVDCHGAHDIQPVARQPQLIAGVCGDCHISTVNEWRTSPHVNIGPLGCATCHSPHTQDIRGNQSVDSLCLNCHKQTPQLWIHKQHIETKEPVGCTNCHMYIAQPFVTLPTINFNPGTTPTGHTMHVDTKPCTTCHEKLPASAPVTQPNTTSQPETVSASAEGGATNISLIQGLLLGLGFGATIAAVIVSRGNRGLVKSGDE
jgi:hypothetical protein